MLSQIKKRNNQKQLPGTRLAANLMVLKEESSSTKQQTKKQTTL